MKPFPGRGIALSAGVLSEEYPESAEYLLDAYWLRMNGDVRVVFVPRLPVAEGELVLPADQPANRDEALSVVLLSAKYAVVVDDGRAGLDGVVQPSEQNAGAAVALFFVGGDEYRALVADLERLCDESGGMWTSSCMMSTFEGQRLVGFLASRVVSSPALSAYARAVLGEESDVPGRSRP